MANVFDIIGPIMIGPSSSHTAGAVRLGLVARAPLGESPARAQVRLHGSFTHTYKGHGTDKALIAGLLGFAPDDLQIIYPHRTKNSPKATQPLGRCQRNTGFWSNDGRGRVCGQSYVFIPSS